MKFGIASAVFMARGCVVELAAALVDPTLRTAC